MTVALVTGGNRGLGFATVRALARIGTCVILAGRDGDQADAVAAALRAEGLDVQGSNSMSRARPASARHTSTWSAARAASMYS